MADITNTIIFDKSTGFFEIQPTTDFSTYTDIQDTTVKGEVKIEIDAGLGYATFYDGANAYATPNYLVTSPLTTKTVTNPLLIALPLNVDGSIIEGTYRVTYNEEFETSGGADYEASNVVFSYENIDKAICLNSSYSCVTPAISVIDNTIYSIGSVAPTAESALTTLEYPNGAALPNLTTTTYPLELNTSIVWTKGYQINASLTLLYDFTTYSERITLTAEDSLNVQCDTLCGVYSCIRELKVELDDVKNVNTVRYNKLLAIYLEAMALAQQASIAVSCDNLDDAASLITNIKELINSSACNTNCSSTCSTSPESTKVTGIGGASGGSGGGSALEVNNGIISDTAVDEIVIGAGLTLTNPTSGTVNVVAEVTQTDLDNAWVAIDSNTAEAGDNTAAIAAMPNVQVSTLVISELSFNALDTVPIVISSGLAGKSIVYLGATIVSGGGTNGITTCDLLISKDPTSGDSGQANAIATARLDSSEVATTAVGGGTSFSVAGGKALMNIGEELYITAVTSSVYDWVGTWNLSVSYIIL